MTLHIVRTDVLLWSLGGFAEPPKDLSLADRYLSAPLRHRLAELVRTNQRVPHGEVKQLADRYGYDRNRLIAIVHFARKRGVPHYWDE